MMYNGEKMFAERTDGYWSEAVPLPFYSGFRKVCTKCQAKFWRSESYVAHYQKQHTDGIRYQRTPTGMVAIDRQI